MEKNVRNFVKDFEEIKPAVNDSPYRRILAVGDIHGNYTRMMSLWNKLNFSEEDLIIFLGDYIEGCGENVKTLKYLMGLSKKENVVMLRGNTENSFIRCFDSENLSVLRNVGFETTKELYEEVRKDPFIIRDVYAFLTAMPYCYRKTIGGKKYIFCHAGIDLSKPMEKQSEETFADGDYMKFYEKYEGEEIIVLGHKTPKKVYSYYPEIFPTPPDFNKPTKIPGKKILLMDTGVKEMKGCVSCVDIMTGEFWQSEER